MAYSDLYRKQLVLLIKMLPFVAQEKCFALKGGTAINLFIRNLPRLSIDIDLTYLPVKERKQSLEEIDHALKKIANAILLSDTTIHINQSAPSSQKEITKLVVRTKDGVQIKIEVTPVLRGCVYEPVLLSVSQQVEQVFGFAEIQVVSFADLYAGKIIAALDRQHPRDLFDVHQLLNNEGISDDLRTAIIIYLISHEHSPHSLLNPVRCDITQDFSQNFMGMTDADISLEMLLQVREQLIAEVVKKMPHHHKDFLRSFYRRQPNWILLGLQEAQHLPAVKWREMNLDKSGKGTCEALLSKLEEVIGRE